MGLKIAEAFKDRCFLTVLATGAPATLLADVTCTVIDESGNRAPLVVTEESDGWYTAPFTPDIAGTWATEWSKTLVPENYVFHYPYKEFKVGGGQEGDIETKIDTIDDLLDTEIADIHTDVGTAITKIDAVDDLLDIEVADIHTDIGTAITKIDAIDDFVDDLETRLSAARAGYIDELAAANVPADVDTLKAAVIVIDEFHDVPGQNSALNAQINEVVGNKTDTTAGDSLIAIAKQIKAKTDNLPADPADDSDLDTSIAAVKAETVLIVADTGELQTDWVNGGRLDLLIDAIKARTDHHEITKTFFSPSQISLTVVGGAGGTINLPTVTLPNITGTITHVYVGFKFRMIENTNVAANKLNAAQVIQIQKAAEGWVTCINLVDDQFGVAASTREGGDCIIGTVDNVATVNVFNDTYELQWLTAMADQSNLVLNDVQSFLIVSYY